MNSREIQAAVRQAENLRVSDQDNVFDAQLIRDFIHHTLEHPATREPLEELLHEHVATGRNNPSAITETLRPIIDDVLSAAIAEDWAPISGELIGEAIDELRWQKRDKDHIRANGPRGA